MVLDMLRKKKVVSEERQELQRNAAILDQAFAQRSKIHVKFDAQASNLTGVTANIMDLHENGLVLELGGVNTLRERFLGQTISCFFKIVERENRHREIFYTFDTTIQRIHQPSERPPLVLVAFPDALHGVQRRKSLRMRPDLQQFSHICLWKYEANGGFDFTKPTMSFGDFKAIRCALENISAGGMRLLVHRVLLTEHGLEPKKGDRFILFFTFAEELHRLREEYWLVCKVNNTIPDPLSGDVVLGLEFIANGVRQAETGKVAWSKIMDNVIEDMAQRIYEWHLTLYREKGLVD